MPDLPLPPSQKTSVLTLLKVYKKKKSTKYTYVQFLITKKRDTVLSIPFTEKYMYKYAFKHTQNSCIVLHPCPNLSQSQLYEIYIPYTHKIQMITTLTHTFFFKHPMLSTAVQLQICHFLKAITAINKHLSSILPATDAAR